MKKFFLTLAAMMVLPLCAMAQIVPDEVLIETGDNVELQVITPAEPVKETKQEIKEREKKLRELNDDVAYAKASNSMRRGYFVLVADYIQTGRAGYRHYNISPNSNFILVQADDGIVQFAINNGSPGSNGLGGWTAKGNVRNKRIKYLDNGDVFFQYDFVGSKVNCSIEITLFHNSKRALARVLGSHEITFYGEILPYRDNKHR